MFVATRACRTSSARLAAGSALRRLQQPICASRALASAQYPGRDHPGIIGHPLMMSSMRQAYQFSPGSGGGASYDDVWPLPVTNTVLNVCPQGERLVVERFGKLLDIKQPGWFLAIPYVDRISYRIDMRERAMAIAPQSAITKDNVSVDVAGILYIQFVDPERAAYGSSNPLYAVRQCAQSAMRAALGELELDDILHARAKVNGIVRANVQEAATAWGMEVKRYEITEVKPDKQITIAMDKQAAAERNRREVVIKAEGDKRSQELRSEGVKVKLRNESEGELIKMKNEAEARKQQYILEGQGEAQAILAKANAYAESIVQIAEALGREKGIDAARVQIAKEYIQMYGLMGSQSNTMLFTDRPGDVSSLMAQAATVFQAAASPPKNPSIIPTPYLPNGSSPQRLNGSDDTHTSSPSTSSKHNAQSDIDAASDLDVESLERIAKAVSDEGHRRR